MEGQIGPLLRLVHVGRTRAQIKTPQLGDRSSRREPFDCFFERLLRHRDTDATPLSTASTCCAHVSSSV
jgi:hypothetical protein